MENSEVKRKRGQRGPGKKDWRRISIHLSVSPKEKEKIYKLAESRGQKVSEFVIRLINREFPDE